MLHYYIVTILKKFNKNEKKFNKNEKQDINPASKKVTNLK